MRLILVTLFVVFAVSNGSFLGLGKYLLPIGLNLKTEINQIIGDSLYVLQPTLGTLSECVGVSATEESRENIQNQISSIQTTLGTVFGILGNVINIDKIIEVSGPIDEIGNVLSNYISLAKSTCTTPEAQQAIQKIVDVTIGTGEDIANVLRDSNLLIPQTVFDSITNSIQVIRAVAL
ncbi:hypothetical protein DMENIID0001_155260 [Sergentomyia squamirostris]